MSALRRARFSRCQVLRSLRFAPRPPWTAGVWLSPGVWAASPSSPGIRAA
jgi:hypothetical protein